MKQCPNCQKVFDDDKKFCQIDGTSLVEMVEATPPVDPFKTIVGGPPITASNAADDSLKTFVMSKEDKEDILQIPETFDAMKTMVVSEPIKPPPPVVNVPVVSAPEPPKFSEPNLSPPTFRDLSANEPVKIEEPPKFESPFSTPVVEAPKVEPPIASPFNPPPVVDTPKFESTPMPSVSSTNDSPFNKPVNAPIPSPFDTPQPPPLKVPAPMFSSEPKPMSSPFDQPASTPFGQANDPFANQQQDSAWSPPPAPVQGWQDQSVGANTPFQPPVAGSGGQNQTLAIVSLVTGILGLCCGILGIVAIITGFMAKGNVDKNPQEFGGRGMAIAGIILGFVSIILGIVGVILQIMFGALGRF